MAVVLQCFSLIFLACVFTTTLAFHSNNGYAGDCGASVVTNSYTADKFGSALNKEKPVLVAGYPNDFYGVWNVYYTFVPGKRLIAHLYKINAYVFEVPATNCTQYTQYAIVVSTCCPYVVELNSSTEGNVPGAGISFKTVFSVIKKNQNYVQVAPCNVIDADFEQVDPTSTYPGTGDIKLYMNGITSYQATSLYGRRNGGPSGGYCYGVTEVCPDTYVEKKFYENKAGNNTCQVPNDGSGLVLAYQQYPFASVTRPGGICRLVTTYALLGGYAKISPLGFSILTFVSPYSDTIYRIIALVTENANIPTFRTLRQTCARLAKCY